MESDLVDQSDKLPRPPAKPLLLWLTESDFVYVDNDGYLSDRPREGAFGIVVPLWNRVGKRALKLPRLLGDTLDENARTCQMLEDEIRYALAATVSAQPTGLAKPNRDLIRVLKGVRAFRARSDSTVAELQRKPHAILVSFQKGTTPRLCAVSAFPSGDSFKAETVEVFPPGARDDLLKAVDSVEKWRALELGDNDDRYEIPAYCQSVSIGRDGRLEHALRPNDLGVVWYAGLPGLVYDWSEKTLQEAIDAGVINTWSPTKMAQLFVQLLNGLRTLHKTILHGDLRPANVMCLDKEIDDPKRYVLIDFGSFIDATAMVSPDSTPSNNTVLAARMIRNRISVFYSPERRQPFEVEGVTTAIVRRDASGHAVILGRESMLSDTASISSGSSPLQDKIEKLVGDIVADQNGTLDPQPTAVAVRGDLLRVQDKLFTIIKEKEVPEGMRADVDRILLCNDRVGRVFNERVAVLVDDQFTEQPAVLSVSGYTIIPKISVADDLYSFASICLYVLLSKSFQHEKPFDGDTVQAGTNSAFIALMSTLDNVSYATAFWRNLELLRPDIEALLKNRNKVNATEAPTILGFREDGTPISPVDDFGSTKENLAARSRQATDEILQNLPHGRRIYSALGHNTASFVLWMHFVICCLHRADRVSQTESTALPNATAKPKGESHGESSQKEEVTVSISNTEDVRPFCTSRADENPREGPANRAFERIDLIIRDAIAQSEEGGILVGFEYRSEATFKPRSELHMSTQLKDLRKKLNSKSFLALTLMQRLVSRATPE
jgi:serine/threonine protein kinase